MRAALHRIVVRVAGNDRTTMQVGRQHERIVQDPVHHGHRFRLAVPHALMARTLIVEPVREIAIQIHIRRIVAAHVVWRRFTDTFLEKREKRKTNQNY